MKLNTICCALLLLFVSHSAYSQRAASGEDCFSGGEAQARECLQLKFEQSEVKLKKAEAAALLAIKKWNDWDSNRNRTRAALKASSTQFRRYRQAQCELQASLAAGGTGTTHLRLLCGIELNTQRISHLQSVKALPR